MPLRIYKVNQTFYYRRRYKGKLFRLSLKTKNLKTAIHKKKLLDLLSGEDMFKLSDGDYEYIFEYDTKEELEEYLEITQTSHEKMLRSLSKYDYTIKMLDKQANKEPVEELNFYDLEFKFVEAKKKAGNVSTSTYKAYESTFNKLRGYFKKRDINNIFIEDYEEFRTHLQIKYKLKNKTINNHTTYISKFIDFAVTRKLLISNNIKGIENLKEEDPNKENFSDLEIQQILAYDFEKEYKDFFKIAIYTGIRLGEIHRLKSSDIREMDGIYYFNVDKSKTTAGIRKVPIHKDILDDVLKMNFPIFPNKTKDAVQKALNRRLYKLIEKKSTKSFHTFRAKFIENAINKNTNDILIIQEVVGHSKNAKDKLTIDTYGKGFNLKLKSDIVDSVNFF